MKIFLCSFFIFVSSCLVACVSFAAGDCSVAVFASEKVIHSLVGSFFGSYPHGNLKMNECEVALLEKIRENNCSVADVVFADAKSGEARKLNTVFGRYSDLSTMPNDTIVKAASIVDENAKVAVACGVSAENRRQKNDKRLFVCANADCKAIDVKTKKRIAMAAHEQCVPDPGNPSGIVTVIRDACHEMGNLITNKIANKY